MRGLREDSPPSPPGAFTQSLSWCVRVLLSSPLQTTLCPQQVPIIAPSDEEEAEQLFQMALKESAEMSVAEAKAVLEKWDD